MGTIFRSRRFHVPLFFAICVVVVFVVALFCKPDQATDADTVVLAEPSYTDWFTVPEGAEMYTSADGVTDFSWNGFSIEATDKKSFAVYECLEGNPDYLVDTETEAVAVYGVSPNGVPGRCIDRYDTVSGRHSYYVVSDDGLRDFCVWPQEGQVLEAEGIEELLSGIWVK